MNTKKGNAKETQTENFSLSKKLKTMDAKELYDMLKFLLKASPEARRLLLEWLKKRVESSKESGREKEVVTLNDELLMEYWKNAEKIISEFNEYGGGSDEDHEEAYSWLNKISELIDGGSISAETKFVFIDAAFVEYNIGNSGFESELMDIFFKICETKDEWRYLVKKLDEQPSNQRKKKVMEIYKDYLCDDETYLKERMKNLQYGADYWDLVEFYINRENTQKALETAEQGILHGEGRLTELFNFLFDHFSKNKDTPNLERIVNTALNRGTEEKAMLNRLFEYYNAQDNYENAKKVLIKAYKIIKLGSYYEEYKRIKEFLKEPDWKQIEPEIFKKVRESNLTDYLRICIDKNMREEVLNTILNPPQDLLRFTIKGHSDEFADKLKEDFPEKIIEYYWKKFYGHIIGGADRKTYREAAAYLGKVKYIYTVILKDESAWNKRFFDLKEEFKKRSALLDELKNL